MSMVESQVLRKLLQFIEIYEKIQMIGSDYGRLQNRALQWSTPKKLFVCLKNSEIDVHLSM